MDAPRSSAGAALARDPFTPPSARELPCVLFLGGIGDQILALPALRALSDVLGGALRLAVVGAPARVLETVPVADRVAVGWDGQRLDAAPIAGSPLLISLTSWPNAAAIVELLRQSGAQRSVGFFPFYGERATFDPQAHMVEKYFSIARHLAPTLRLERYEGPVRCSPEVERQASAAGARLRRPGRRLAFFHPETKAHKEWPRERWSVVLRDFLERAPDFDLVVISARPYALELGELAARALPFHESLETTLATLACADLFIGVDSCFLHAADALCLPGLALFGATDPASWGFRRSRAFAHVVAPAGRLDDLSPLAVALALGELLERIQDSPRSHRSMNERKKGEHSVTR
jgi:ADP-heptose:LPS heptosyltransferase